MNIVISSKFFQKITIFLEAERKIKGLEKSANGDGMALIEITTADLSFKPRHMNPADFHLGFSLTVGALVFLDKTRTVLSL